MKRVVPVIFLVIGYLAGYVSGPTAATEPTQGETARQQPAPTHPTEAMYWSIEALKQGHADLVARAASRQTGASGSPVSVRTPSHTMSLLHRRYHGTPRLSPRQIMSMWDDGETHEGNYDFYVIVGGSGTVVTGGTLENSVRINPLDRPGEFRGQPITNGVSYKVKEGDWLLLPPNVPHWPQPDPGGLTYLRMVIYIDGPR